jgi:hypothetical protein
MAFNYSPKVVTDGLVLYLDAGNNRSYASGSTSWLDLSRGGNVGTLINGPTFSSANGGSLFFDGTNDYVDLNSNNIVAGTNPFTIESFYKTTGASNGAIFTNYGGGFATGVWFAGRYGIYINNSVYAVGAPLPLGTYHMAATRDGSGNVRLYINGVLNNTGTLTQSIPSNINFRIGSNVNVFNEPLTGNLYSLKVYNRVLSAQEVLQNYNALKGRFNL